MNTKAQLFEALVEQVGGKNWFLVEELGDTLETKRYQGHLSVLGYRVPVYLYINNSLFSVVRVVLSQAPLKGNVLKSVWEHLNTLNKTYTANKYYIGEDRNVFLDITLPAQDNDFDPNMILHILQEFLPAHLEQELPAIVSVLGEKTAEELVAEAEAAAKAETADKAAKAEAPAKTTAKASKPASTKKASPKKGAAKRKGAKK